MPILTQCQEISSAKTCQGDFGMQCNLYLCLSWYKIGKGVIHFHHRLGHALSADAIPYQYSFSTQYPRDEDNHKLNTPGLSWRLLFLGVGFEEQKRSKGGEISYKLNI